MAILRGEEIQNMSKEELDEKVFELKSELFRERSKIASGGAPENPGRIAEIRRTIARIYTMQKMQGKGRAVKKEKKVAKAKEELSK